MDTPTSQASGRARTLLFVTQPQRWSYWPFLPLVKRLPGQSEVYGVLFDALGSCDLPGFAATVLLTNLFLMPRQLSTLLALPKEVFDAPEEMVDAGWCVD
jgi:hypothetical protein